MIERVREELHKLAREMKPEETASTIVRLHRKGSIELSDIEELLRYMRNTNYDNPYVNAYRTLLSNLLVRYVRSFYTQDEVARTVRDALERGEDPLLAVLREHGHDAVLHNFFLMTEKGQYPRQLRRLMSTLKTIFRHSVAHFHELKDMEVRLSDLVLAYHTLHQLLFRKRKEPKVIANVLKENGEVAKKELLLGELLQSFGIKNVYSKERLREVLNTLLTLVEGIKELGDVEVMENVSPLPDNVEKGRSVSPITPELVNYVLEAGGTLRDVYTLKSLNVSERNIIEKLELFRRHGIPITYLLSSNKRDLERVMVMDLERLVENINRVEKSYGAPLKKLSLSTTPSYLLRLVRKSRTTDNPS